LVDRIRRLFGSGDDEPTEVVFLVGTPRSTLDIADELERERAAKAEPVPSTDT
jgi:hypothetical protein